MKKILSALLLSTLCLFASAQIVNPNPPGSVNWTAPGTIGSATPNSGAFTHLTTNEVISAALNQGTYAYGTLGYTDTGLLASYTASLNGYIQVVLTNSNAGASASADYIVGNNLNTATTYYGDFGMNSSGFTGTGSMNLPNAVYFYGYSGDLVLGTQTANAVHLLANNAATDAITISSANVPTINSPVLVTPALGTPASGTITNLTGTCASCNISGSATNATNLAGGAADSIPYQTGTGATGFIPAGTNGYVMQMVSGVPAWANSSGVFNPAAVAITGGTINGTTIGATTPSTVAATTISATGAITPSQTAGIVGTTAANNANAGSVGEYFATTVTSTPALTTGTAANATASPLSLGAGDWDVWAVVSIQGTGTTSFSYMVGGLSLTSATIGAFGSYWQYQMAAQVISNYTQAVPIQRYSFSTSTTVYCIAYANFTVSTASTQCTLYGRRVR